MAKSDLEMLQKVPIFSELSKKHIKFVLKESNPELFSPGQTIVKQGDPGGRFFVIFEGLADVLQGNRKKAKLGAGDYFGEMSVLDRHPRSATVQADTHVRGVSLASWNFLALVEENPSMAKNLLTHLSKRVRALEGAAHSH